MSTYQPPTQADHCDREDSTCPHVGTCNDRGYCEATYLECLRVVREVEAENTARKNHAFKCAVERGVAYQDAALAVFNERSGMARDLGAVPVAALPAVSALAQTMAVAEFTAELRYLERAVDRLLDVWSDEDE